MNIALWIVQAVLAIMFVMVGFLKMVQPREKLAERMGWVDDFSPTSVKLIGALEVLGGVGLILPLLTGILPWLTSLAALGLALTMLGAIATHFRRREYSFFVPNAVLLALAVFVAFGRFAV